MATSHAGTTLKRIGQFVRRSWRSIALCVGKWLAVLLMAISALNLWLNAGSNTSDRTIALFILTLFIASLAYWIFVSSRVKLRFPGIDESKMETAKQSTRSTAGTRIKFPWQNKQEDKTRTIQVSRLSTDAAPVLVANDAPLPVLRAEATLIIDREPESDETPDVQIANLVRGVPFSIPARSTQPTSVTKAFDHVGIYRLRSSGVRVYDLFGLLSRVHGLSGQWRVRVVPNIYRLTRGIPTDRRSLQEDLGIPDTPSDALDYDRVRDYRPGDPLKTIHWKLVAHGQGDLYTKLFETATASSVMLLIDPYAPRTGSADALDHMYDTMLEGAFSLLEHARENGISGRLRFISQSNSLIEAEWEGAASLGWFVETAKRPSHEHKAYEQSAQAIRHLRNARAGYTIFATSNLTETSVEELIACHHEGIPLLVVHALPEHSQRENELQCFFDELLRTESIDVIDLSDGPQIVREVAER